MLNAYSSIFGTILIVSMTIARLQNIDTSCPCDFNATNESLDCSGRKLKLIPDCVLSRTNIRYLDLSRNSITIIPAGTFYNFTKLQTLNVSRNLLTYLENETFTGLYNLEVLSLAHNSLNRNDSFSSNMLVPLTKLHSLHIQGNLIGPEADYPDRTLAKASSVRFLAIDGLPRKKFGIGFSGMTNLGTLRMNDNDGLCNMDHILPETFANFRSTPLEHIELIHCSMHYIPPYTFSDLTNLTSIKATWSRTMCEGMVDNFTIGLDTTNIKRLQLTQMCHIMSFRLSEDCFRGLTNTTLEYLDLESNKIEYISRNAIFKLPKTLRYFSLKDNFLDDIKFLAKMVVLPNLEVFDMSYQNYYNIERNLKDLTPFKLHEKDTSILRPTNFTRFRLFRRHISINNGTEHKGDRLVRNKVTLGKNIPGSIDDRIHLPRNLRDLYFSHLRLDSYAIIPLTFAPNSLQYLDGSTCQLQGFFGPWVGLHHLKFLNLSFNRFRIMHPKSFSDMINLETLLLQNNEIGDVIMDVDTKGDLFANLTKLLTLDLTKNSIRNLPRLIFRNQRKLVTLSLSWNSLSNIPFTLDTMVDLRLLNISFNQINFITPKVSEQLDKIASISDLEIDLRGNPLSCDCDRLSFVNWLVNTNVKLTEGDHLSCLYSNGSKVSFQHIGYIRNQLQIECVSWIILIVSACGLFILLVVISFFALYHHKRWQLRYLVNRNKGALNPFHSLLGEEIRINNDVYISYEPDFILYDGTSLDSFVKERLLSFLLGKGFTVLFQDNLQSEAGKSMGSIITQTVRRTRKVIAILSSSYFFSGDTWKAWEFNMAVYEGIYTKRAVIVPVMVGELTQNDLKRQPEIRYYLKSMEADVLKFPTREGSVDSFLKEIFYKIQN